MIKKVKRLLSFMLVLVMCVTFCPIEPLRTLADDPNTVTYECQPQSKTYDSETDKVTVAWSMNVQSHWRVIEADVYIVNGKNSSFFTRLNNDWSANHFSYDFPVTSPNNYKYFVRTYYCENVSSPSSIYHIDSEEFTITYADKRFLRQPESGLYNQSTGELDVKWSTNFKPEKVEVCNGPSVIDTLSPIGANGSYSFDAAVSSKPGYYLRAYWDDEHYKESNTFGVTSKLEFVTQLEDVAYYMNDAEVEVPCATNFNPYKAEVIRKTGDERVVYSSLYSHMTSSISCRFKPTVDTGYFVRAYMNDNGYVDSETFRTYYPNGFKFLKEPQDGQYRAATMDFEAYFQLSFTPALINLYYYDEDDDEYKSTNNYELLTYTGNNYTIVVPYDFINTPLKVIAEYYGIDSDGNAKSYSVSSRVFIARSTAASFTEQPTGDTISL